MTNASMPTTFKNVGKTNKVGVNVGARIFNAMPYASLCCQIHNMAEVMILEKFEDGFFISEINLRKLKILILQKLSQSILF